MLALVWYDWFKAFHVTAAVLWVGGGTMLTILALLTVATKDPVRIAGFTQQVVFLGERFFPPVSLALLALGFGLMENGASPWSYHLVWVQIALAGWAFSFLLGMFVIGPRAKRLKKLLATRGPEDVEVQSLIRRILLIARIDVVVLIFIVFDMAAKPWW